MKKQLLLIASSLFFVTAHAQYKVLHESPQLPESRHDYLSTKNSIRAELDTKNTANKTTAALSRWYSYTDWFDTSEIDMSSTIGLSAVYMWKDTMAVMAYSGTTPWAHNRNVSVGMAVDPTFLGFNNPSYYPGQMHLTNTNAYIVDSIRFFGIYGFNPAKTAVVDTLRVAFVYGDATYGNASGGPDVYLAKTGNPVVLTRYGVSAPDSMSTYRMRFDTVTTKTFGPTVVIRDIILDNSGTSPAWGDTLSDGTYYGIVGFPDVNIPASNMIGATITFISGDPAFTAHDTVFGSSIGYKYNMFRQYIAFRGSSASPVFASYSATNRNSGMFKTLPDTTNGWGRQYIPLWFWSASGGGASTLQYPYIDFHVKCTTCGTVGVKTTTDDIRITQAYPNPTSGELTIPFELAKSSNVTVTLTNMMGQVVATRNINSVAKGKATFNTTLYAPGIYTATVYADGHHSTVRVAINH